MAGFVDHLNRGPTRDQCCWTALEVVDFEADGIVAAALVVVVEVVDHNDWGELAGLDKVDKFLVGFDIPDFECLPHLYLREAGFGRTSKKLGLDRYIHIVIDFGGVVVDILLLRLDFE
jgi:hypothetical protein